MANRTRWSEQHRQQALAVLVESGLAEAHRQTGIPKPTICAWADAEGIDRGRLVEHSLAERVAHANATVVVNWVERRSEFCGLLSEIAFEAGQSELLAVRQFHADLAAGNVEAATNLATLAQIVGSRTRAVHDLQLLEGGATERAESAERVAALVGAGEGRVSQLRSVG